MQFEHRSNDYFHTLGYLLEKNVVTVRLCVRPSVCLCALRMFFSLPGEITTKQRWLPLALDQQNVNTSDSPPRVSVA